MPVVMSIRAILQLGVKRAFNFYHISKLLVFHFENNNDIHKYMFACCDNESQQRSMLMFSKENP